MQRGHSVCLYCVGIQLHIFIRSLTLPQLSFKHLFFVVSAQMATNAAVTGEYVCLCRPGWVQHQRCVKISRKSVKYSAWGLVLSLALTSWTVFHIPFLCYFEGNPYLVIIRRNAVLMLTKCQAMAWSFPAHTHAVSRKRSGAAKI